MGHAQIWAFPAGTPIGSRRFFKVLYPTNYHARFGTSITKMHNSVLTDLTTYLFDVSILNTQSYFYVLVTISTL